MSGRIIFEPKRPTACERGTCEGKPKPERYQDGTVWQCDGCGSLWEVWSGAQYNEPFSAWRRVGEPIPGWGTGRTNRRLPVDPEWDAMTDDRRQAYCDAVLLEIRPDHTNRSEETR